MALWTLANLSIPPVDWRDAKDVSLFTLGGAQGDASRPIAQVRSKGSNSANALTGNGSVNREEAGFPTGMPAMVFYGGGSQPLTSENIDGFPVGAADCTIILVASMWAAGFYPEVIDYGPSQGGAQCQIFATGETRNLVASNNGTDGNSGVDSTSGVVVIGVWQNGNLVLTYTNGSRSPAQVSAPFNTGVAPMRLGVSGFPGAIAESAVLSYAVTGTDELDRISASLAWKWGLQNKLAAKNAYKAAAPETAPGASATGAGAATLAGIVGAAASALLIVGAGAGALGSVVSAGAGGVRATAASAVTMQPVTGAAFTTSLITASAAEALGAIASVSGGSVPIAAAAAGSLGEIVAGSATRADPHASASNDLGAVIGRASSGSVQTVTGSAEATLGTISLAAAGTVRLTGTGVAALGQIASSGAGSAIARAFAAGVLSDLTSNASGSLTTRAAAPGALGELLSTAVAYLPATARAVPQLGGIAASATATGDGTVPDPIVIPLRHRFVILARQRRFTVPRRQRSLLIRKGTCMSSITKYAVEERQYQADWTADLNGQTIVGEIAATSTDPTLVVDRVTYDGPIMKFWVQGGTSGKVATIRFVASTSGVEHPAWQQAVICY